MSTRKNGRKSAKSKPVAKAVEATKLVEQYGHNAALIPVEDLWYGNLDCKPINHSWDGETYATKWEYYAASRCEECGELIVGRGGEKHCDLDGDSDCTGYVPENEGPMMSYYYPLDVRSDFDAIEAAKRLVNLPLCVVEWLEEDNGRYALALTGGGMDLSWEICEAFMRLGYLPPVHFASDLPQMAGRGTSERDRWIIAGCRRSLRGVKEQIGRALRRLRENFPEAADAGQEGEE